MDQARKQIFFNCLSLAFKGIYLAAERSAAVPGAAEFAQATWENLEKLWIHSSQSRYQLPGYSKGIFFMFKI